MTREQFDNYSFSIDTQIKVDGAWKRINAVDFCRALIEITNKTITHNQIEEIKD